MANEIRFTGSIVTTATNFSETIAPGQISIDLPSGPDLTAASGVVIPAINSVSPTGTAIVATDLTNAKDGGVFFFRNLATAAGDNIEIGTVQSSAFVPFLLLKPGEYAMGRLSSLYPVSNALRAKAAANTPPLQYKIFAGDL